MAPSLPPGLVRFTRSPWFLLVAASWLEACSGVGSLYITYSSAIKSSLGYSQTQITSLGVAKDWGFTFLLTAGFSSDLLPIWALLLLGAFLTFLGFGWLWLVVAHHVSVPSFWIVCVLMFLGTQGGTFLDIGAMVYCLPRFPHNRGPVLGVLKSFKALSAAIFSQIYATFFAPNQSSALILVAAGPAIVVVSTTLILWLTQHQSNDRRRIEEDKSFDSITFNIFFIMCSFTALYLLAVLIIGQLTPTTDVVNIVSTAVLLLLTILPISAPLISMLYRSIRGSASLNFPEVEAGMKESLLKEESSFRIKTDIGSSVSSEQGSENTSENINRSSERKSDLPRGACEAVRGDFPSKLHLSSSTPTTEAGDRKETRGDPQIGKDYSLLQALRQISFWLLFLAIFFGLGSNFAVSNNLGQIAQAQGYKSSHVFLSISSIGGFFGHLAGGYSSETIVRRYALPRSLILAASGLLIALGQVLFAMAWPGSIYAASALLGLGSGSIFAVFPAVSSELFGLRRFGSIFGVLGMSKAVGSLVFSGLIAGAIFDWEAKKRSNLDDAMGAADSSRWAGGGGRGGGRCEGEGCFFVLCMAMAGASAAGVVCCLLLSWRTRLVYEKTVASVSRHKKSLPQRRVSFRLHNEEEEGEV